MAPATLSKDDLTIKPVTMAEWPDLQALFSEPGPQNGCWCMYWRVKRAEFHRHYGEDHRRAMEQIIASGRVPGILAYFEGQPIGWCSIAPREEFPVLDRSRTLKRVDDEPVWSIVCFFVARQYRGRGLTRALIEAAVEYARGRGARIIEAYPLVPKDASYPQFELYTGLISTFEKLGFVVVARRSERRPLMRYHCAGEGDGEA
jgi:GNAT superfamily N-acetyltransferase